MRRKWLWTDFQLDKINQVIQIIDELKEYLPLTLRQVYYQLVGKGYIENNKSQYGMLSNLLKWGRIDGYIAWDVIEDRVRKYRDNRGWDNQEQFVRQELNSFLSGYKRDLMQSQDCYLEVWIEKDALATIFDRICGPHGISVVVCRGFSSISFLNDFKERLSWYQGKQPVMLYFGDFDPSGMEMLRAMEITLETELNIQGIRFKRIALLEDDIFKYELPNNPDALKKTDSRAKKHVEQYGELAVELDALHPAILEQKIKDAIDSEINISLFNQEVLRHNAEFDKLNEMREIVVSYVKGL